jgi:tRNA-2-methylthio-N6-dimethylallyladenosine synthase
LLEAVHAIPGIERIRFASPHPRHTSQRLIAAVRDLPKVCKHLHLPVQSGSTRVLGLMRRRHSREEYLDLVARIRGAIPKVQLSTDMIVGFPGEPTPISGDAVADAVQSQHVSFNTRSGRHPGIQADAGRRGRKKTRRIVALQGSTVDPIGPLRQSIGSTLRPGRRPAADASGN